MQKGKRIKIMQRTYTKDEFNTIIMGYLLQNMKEQVVVDGTVWNLFIEKLKKQSFQAYLIRELQHNTEYIDAKLLFNALDIKDKITIIT